ncbi:MULTISPECIES: DUF1501 domain-containing protein [Sphingobacterium]|uniref:DUF1501 domain-containing protein n=1 Tax=Sphingobacterium TaxID=28453 RepID=UPI0013D9BB8F|nr:MULTISPECIES: DUF1501 domain-containing protein [unclassified Sphingobacterium]
MLIKRRTFLQTTALASASLFLPKFLNAMAGNTLPDGRQKVLIVIQLTGGNDGLNTLIPYTNDLYYSSRPAIAIGKNQALRINDDAGLNPHLPILKTLHDEGCLAVLNNVGYPEPNRSHFRSMDIWHTASNPDEYLSTGWLGRYLDHQCKDCDLPVQLIETDDILSLALKGEQYQGITFRDPRKLYTKSQEQFYKNVGQVHHHEHEMADYLYKILGDTINSTNYILEKSRTNPSTADYPSTAFGNNLKHIASLIRSDINTSVYYVSLGSFDTHVRQVGRQTELFKELNAGLEVFIKDLKKENRFKDTLIMTFSEFGRRVAQNASAGTDHGTANNMFFISGALRQKGIINALPDLSNLSSGDLQYSVDFKNVYATILDKWLNSSAPDILGRDFKTLDFI